MNPASILRPRSRCASMVESINLAPIERPHADRLLHPLMLGALTLWLLNDHVLKAHFAAAWWTGKLSDVAGMVVFPCFIAALLELTSLQRRISSRALLMLSIALTTLAFSMVKLTPQGAWLYQTGLGLAQWPWHASRAWLHDQALPNLRLVHLTMDPTDLWTLPFALAGLLLGEQQSERLNATAR